MKPRAIEDIYPLSPLQQGMLFHELYAPESKEYLVQICWTVSGPLDPALFERAWNAAVARHPILRTELAWEDVDEPVQVVYREMRVSLDYRDWRSSSEGEIDSRLKAFLEEDRERRLDLSRLPLFRVSLLHVREGEFRFVFTFHHVLLDGWSLVRVLSEVLAYCEAELSGRKAALLPSRPYRDYIAWLKKQDLARARDFWQTQLAGFESPTALSIENPYRLVEGDPYAEETLLLSEETSDALSSFTRTHRVTLNTLFQGAWAVLLSRYSGDEDVVFGATVSGRPPELEGIESMVGLFINTLPLRARVRGNAPFLAWLEALQLRQAETRQFEYTPLWEIQGWAGIPRGTPLFETLLVFENFPTGALGKGGKGNADPLDAGPKLSLSDIRYWTHTSYPLHLRVRPSRRTTIDLNYDRRRFDQRTVRSVLSHLARLLDAVLEEPSRKLSDLPRLYEGLEARDRKGVDMRGAGARDEFPRSALECSIADRFRTVAAAHGQALAIETETHRFTYTDLAREVSRVSDALRRRGSEGDRVALLFEHGAPMIVAILAALEAGRIYVPLDPSYPRERLLEILADSGANVILTAEPSSPQARAVAPEGVVVLDLDAEPPPALDGERPAVPPDALAYILYTSGTTGAPKGTVQNHRNVLHHARAYSEGLRIGPGDRLTLLSSYSFDASIMAIFGALLNGAALFPFSVTREGIDRLPRWLSEKRITLYHSTPTVFRYFVASLGKGETPFPDLRAIVLGGEEVTRRDVGLYRKHFSSGAILVNGLGPTESTLAVQYFIDGEREIPGERVPVGFPVEDTEIWLLDDTGERTELHGEIGIRSRHVAVGYWGKPELTRERFLPDPEGFDRRIYRTGDRGRFLPGGELEFLGRKDFQVKVRGMRVETGAVEAFLAAHPAVEECAVAGRVSPSGETLLAAYFVPREGKVVAPNALRSFLEEKLPSHMVPSIYTLLESMPLTATGKIDRKRLPEASLSGVESGPFEGPRTVTEEMLCGIWSDVLAVPKIAIHDDFFELGGHSLRATQVASRIREAWGIALPLRALFEAPTVASLASRIEASSRQDRADEAIPLLPRDRDLPLSFSQERLWFFDQMEPESATYNVAGAIRFEGPLNLDALERSLVEIVRRHETLRSSFRSADGRPAVRVDAEDGLVFTVVSFGGDDRDLSSWLKTEAARPFDLSRGALLRPTLLRISERDQVLALVTHHIVCDGWSLGILLRELGALYEAFSRGDRSPLPALPVQYADFAAWQRSALRGETLAAQLAFWKSEIGGEIPALALPTDRPRPHVLSYRGAREPFRLSSGLSSALRKLSRGEDATLFMTLFAAWNALLSRHTGQEDILVGSPIAGRSRVEVEPLIGCFVNTLALRTDLSGDPSFRELLVRVRRKTLDAFAHQDLPFEKLVQELQPERDLARNPVFQVVFALQNAPPGRLALPGLTTRGVEIPSDRAHFDLTFTLVESGGEIFGALEYGTDLFDASTIRGLLDRFERLLEGAVRDPGRRLSELPLLGAAELAALESFDASGAWTTDGDVVRWFDRAVLAGPSKVAVSRGPESMSYAELAARANAVACEIQNRGAGPDSIVGLLLPRSFDLIASLVGAARSGAAVLALDGSYPAERLAFMIEDSGVSLVLTARETWSRHEALHRFNLSPIFVEELGSAPKGPKIPLHPDSLLYVSYTSGSTGLPKGVEVPHRAVVRLVKDQTYASLGEDSRILHLAPLTFDASTFEILGSPRERGPDRSLSGAGADGRRSEDRASRARRDDALAHRSALQRSGR